MSKKMVFKLTMEDQKMKIRAMKAVAGSGVDSVEVSMEDGTLTALGAADPVYLSKKLRKVGCRPKLLSVGPVEEEDAEEDDAVEAPPPVVYNAYPSGYGYPSYMFARNEFPNGWMLL